MFRRVILCAVLLFGVGVFCFGQTVALRDYVGMISQGFHPDIITFLEKLQDDLEKRGYSNSARNLGFFLKGDSGTGFVYVKDGKSYILTNYHVISQAHTLSITFETIEGEKTKFSDLTIVAADEDMDIALLSFAGGQNPFQQGLAFLTRPIQEGEDVYSAGFPGAGTALIWQLGRGIISNASVRLPPEDDDDKMIGPYIQHTAQVDGGNSGGPLLVQATGVPTGFAVVGINTLSIRRRQAANYSIPLNRIQSFLDESMKPPVEDQKPLLEARVGEFTKGLSASKAVYPHIATFLSNVCTGENAEYAINEMLGKASKSVRDDIFDKDIIASLTYSVAWTIENSLRSKSGSISIETGAITPAEDGTYNVEFTVDKKTINSVWIMEHGVWRIRSFGDFASGDKKFVEKKQKEKKESQNLRTEPSLQLSAGVALPFDYDGAVFGVDIGIRYNKHTGSSFDVFIADGYKNFISTFDIFVPIPAGSVAFTPFVKGGLGLLSVDRKIENSDPWATPSGSSSSREDGLDLPSLGFSVQGGLQFTTAFVPGLYLQVTYQHNFYKTSLFAPKSEMLYPSMLFFSVGYSF